MQEHFASSGEKIAAAETLLRDEGLSRATVGDGVRGWPRGGAAKTTAHLVRAHVLEARRHLLHLKRPLEQGDPLRVVYSLRDLLFELGHVEEQIAALLGVATATRAEVLERSQVLEARGATGP